MSKWDLKTRCHCFSPKCNVLENKTMFHDGAGEKCAFILKETFPAPCRVFPSSLTQLRARRSSKVRNTQRLGHSLGETSRSRRWERWRREWSPPLVSSPAAVQKSFPTLIMHHYQGTNSSSQGHSHSQEPDAHTAHRDKPLQGHQTNSLLWR